MIAMCFASTKRVDECLVDSQIYGLIRLSLVERLRFRCILQRGVFVGSIEFSVLSQFCLVEQVVSVSRNSSLVRRRAKIIGNHDAQ
jgi:hypothetical protein